MDAYRPGGDNTPYLEPLFGFGNRVADDDIVYAMGVQLRHRCQQTLDDSDGQIIGTVEAKFTALGLSDSGAVTGYNICFLHRIIF
jgi:hypothetical protein